MILINVHQFVSYHTFSVDCIHFSCARPHADDENESVWVCVGVSMYIGMYAFVTGDPNQTHRRLTCAHRAELKPINASHAIPLWESGWRTLCRIRCLPLNPGLILHIRMRTHIFVCVPTHAWS